MRREGAAQRPRVVLFVPPGRDRDRWIRLLAGHALARGWEVAAISSTATDALRELHCGRADRVVVVDAYQLAPLVEVVTANPRPVPESQRRTGRLP